MRGQSGNRIAGHAGRRAPGQRVGESGSIHQKEGRRICIGEETPDGAGLLVLAVRTAAVGRARNARQRCDRPIDRAKDAADGHLLRPLEEDVASGSAAAARDQPLVLQVEENVLKEFSRNAFRFCHCFDLHGRAFRLRREVEQGLERILGLLGNHGLRYTTLTVEYSGSGGYSYEARTKVR